MRFIFHKIIFTVLLALVLSSLTFNSFAALIKSTGNGNWDAAATWDLGRVPQDGDEILVDVGHEVTLITSETLNNVIIAVRGTLRFFRQWITTGPNWWNGYFLYGELILDANSVVVIEDTGLILSDSFIDDNNIITIDGVDEWNGGDGDLTGPSYIDDSGPNSGEPPGYVPLPIELISFNANLTGEVVEILWATAAEIDNDYFTLERSEDGVNWEIIGEEAGAGNSTIRLDYSFIDHNPIPGISYYRLKQTDYDGQFEYFDPAVVLYEPDNLFKVFPNPTTDILQLTTLSDLSNAVISIKNLSGQNKAVRVDASSHQASIDVSELPTGVYLLEIVFPQSVLTKRIVKN